MEQSHKSELETVTKENCSPTKLSPNGQSGHATATNPDGLKDAKGPFSGRMSTVIGCSGQTEVESLPKVFRQTSEQPFTSLGTEFIRANANAKTSPTGGGSALLRHQAFPYTFANTRHESYGNLGIAGLAGLSSTSATLALLGQSRAVTLPSPPAMSSSAVTSAPPVANVVSAGGTTSLDLQDVGHSGKPAGASSDIAASVRDRRSTFFSEPPKPISLPTRSASDLSSLCDEGFGSGLTLQTNYSSRGSKDSIGLSGTPVSRSVLGSFNSLTTMSALDTPSSRSLVSQQQESVGSATEPSLLCPDAPRTVSSQRDVSAVLFSEHSATPVSDSEETSFKVWCGPPHDDPCIFKKGMWIFPHLRIMCYRDNVSKYEIP